MAWISAFKSTARYSTIAKCPNRQAVIKTVRPFVYRGYDETEKEREIERA